MNQTNGPLAKMTFRFIILLVGVTILSVFGSIVLIGQRNAVLSQQAAGAAQILENQAGLLVIQQQILSETKRATLENQRLLRFLTCINKIVPEVRKNQDVDACVKASLE